MSLVGTLISSPAANFYVIEAKHKSCDECAGGLSLSTSSLLYVVCSAKYITGCR